MIVWLKAWDAAQKSAKILIFFAILFIILISAFTVLAEDPTPTPTPSSGICSSVPECSDQKLDCPKCIEYLSNKKNEATSRAKTLSSEIAVMDRQIKLTEARILATQQLIEGLERDIVIAREKISRLQEDINKTTKALIARIATAYQIGTIEPWEIFLSSSNIKDVFTRLKYLRIVQIYDRKKVYAAEQAKNDYSNQKAIYEDKELRARSLNNKLEDYTDQLETEKLTKQELLKNTRNDEAKYQRLLAQARAERAIVLGGGKETFSRNVNAGDSIGTVISGTSGCSTGTHLHFSIYQGISMHDPSEYLSPKSFTYSYGDNLFGVYGSINPRGTYPWPLDDPIKINQGFGSHSYASRYPGGVHDGIDMDGGSLSVKAVRAGKLYAGSYGGCSYGPLSYAKVEHDDGLITWYLHIYPN